MSELSERCRWLGGECSRYYGRERSWCGALLQAADELERLRGALREAATMTEHEEDRTLIYNHCLQALEEVSDE